MQYKLFSSFKKQANSLNLQNEHPKLHKRQFSQSNTR